MSDPGFFEILDSTRAIKRLKPNPVPLELIRKVLATGTKAPSGVNTQPWEFLVVRDPDTKKWCRSATSTSRRSASVPSSTRSNPPTLRTRACSAR